MAFVRVQGTNHENGVTTTPFCTLGATVGVGNAIFVTVVWDSGVGDTVTGITDDKGNVYTLVDLLRNATNSGSMQTAYFLNAINAPITITATLSAADNFVAEVMVDEYSGIATSAALDGHAINSQDAPGTGADAVTSTNANTTVNGNLIYGVSGNLDGNTNTAGTGYTIRQSNTAPTRTMFSEDRVQASAGAIAATFTAGTVPSHCVTAVMAFKAPAASDTLFGQACL